MNLKQTLIIELCIALAASVALGPPLHAQQTADAQSESPIPVITGDFNFQSTFQPGMKMLMPEFDPVLLLPIGNKLLIESEYDMSTNLTDTSGQWSPAVVNHGLEYLQLNYIVHPNLTLSVGRFLTPFGIFRERLHPMWIRNIAADPLIFPMDDNSSNGAMARGAARLSNGVNLTYATYFSALTRNNQLQSDRRAGGRASVFFPDKRFEIGVSYARVLSDTHYGMIGGDITWSPKQIPVDFRAEFEQTTQLGKGYWVEAAYHLNRLGRAAFFRNSLLALRQEQYWTPTVAQTLVTGLPDRSTTAPTLGWTYTLYNGVRFNASYGRNFATTENHNMDGRPHLSLCSLLGRKPMKRALTLLLLCLCASPLLAGDDPKKTAVDPDDAYKNNCMRCHTAVRKYSPRQTATIVMHMRVRANMTAEETQAILQYLAESEPAKPATSAAYGHK